jgi:hypothetical protein
MKAHHAKLRDEAAERLWAHYQDLVKQDAAYQADKPARVKELDDILDQHIFRPLFS